MAYEKEKEFVKKWLPLLDKVDKDASLKDRCRRYNPYISSKFADELIKDLDFFNFLEEAYESNIVFNQYMQTIEEDPIIFDPTDEYIASLDELQIICCITYHFRADHWDNGFLISTSFVNGSLLKYFKALLKDVK